MEELKQKDLDNLADIIWWLKGYEAATQATFEGCAFNGDHLKSLVKTQSLLKEKVYGPPKKVEAGF